MGVTRTKLPFEGHFTQIPNAWLRDQKLSRRARGLLAEVMSHQVGWHVSIASLVANGSEGKAAIRAAMLELRDAGYLTLSQKRGEQGRWNEVEYELSAPTGVRFSDSGQSTGVRFPASRESDAKKTSSSEDHLEEDMLVPPGASESVDESFVTFWKLYPRKVGKVAASRAWQHAIKRAPAQVIIAGARRFAADPNLPEKHYIPHPTSWLNAGRWDDESLPARAGGDGGRLPPELEGLMNR
ncbi:hypothetical protein C5B94_03860 [Clavibacter michiganensis]|uniref:hypothetical protein n=1 Tax=Clavibacter michiganensis TaxID=28447 RepID=UPI000CE7CE3A|nr:hypothetical protein [Clavibacter michiganensis]PPF56065.1 hypothetical protein C5B94_03860 [Clavibacter michiganensis]